MYYRFEGKHKIATQYAATSGNFINVAASVADIHQISHAADLMETLCPVRDELQTAKKCSRMNVSSHQHAQYLTALGIDRTSVVRTTKHATMGGFHFKAGLYAIMPTRENNLPVFGLIVELLTLEKSLILIVQEQETLYYDELYGAYPVRPRTNDVTRAIFSSSLPSMDTISPWRRSDVPDLKYLSCRTVIN